MGSNNTSHQRLVNGGDMDDSFDASTTDISTSESVAHQRTRHVSRLEDLQKYRESRIVLNETL